VERQVPVKRVIAIAVMLVLGASACRRIVDLTPVLRDAINDDGGFGPDAFAPSFDAGPEHD
jgi:hypothetical protein